MIKRDADEPSLTVPGSYIYTTVRLEGAIKIKAVNKWGNETRKATIANSCPLPQTSS